MLPRSGPAWLAWVLVAVGALAVAGAIRRGFGTPPAAWFLAGLTLVGGVGLRAADERLTVASLIDHEPPIWLRARLTIVDGWSTSRWGWQTVVEVRDARHAERPIDGLGHCRLEVRGRTDPRRLPEPGSVVDGLVSVRGSPDRPLLVTRSADLLHELPERSWLPVTRDHLARHLVEAAGTDVRRLRAAELAAALALGRRDLIPREQREMWRRSGLAHVLAVSGLHVGLVGGVVWLVLYGVGASPTTTRIAILLALPAYALLAGSSPSAVRAALMGMTYVGARLLGRALVPMAAVLIAASALLAVHPALIGQVSFQLTVLITAALVRWAPALTGRLPLPRWLAAAVAVPIIAQVAAAPLVAQHFRTAIPGAAVANLLVPWLLAPVVVAAVAATLIAPISGPVADWLLALVATGGDGLWFVSRPGRAVELVTPEVPPVVLALLIASGLAALLPWRRATIGAAVYAAVLTGAIAWWRLVPPTAATAVELLPVSHGLAVEASSGRRHLLMDGGGTRREAAELLAPRRIHHIDAVLASHGDEDHIAGLATVIRTIGADRLILPAWLTSRPEVVPLLRQARRRGTRIVPVARGSRVPVGGVTVDILWPPAIGAPDEDNERSMVARLRIDGERVLLTADIGRSSERELVASGPIGCSLLVVPHHGSRGSSSPDLLDAVGAHVALIPAGPENLHHHPHPDVLARLDARGIRYRMPIRDGRCGARLVDGRWQLYP
ncbi:MAG: DNA internalization-related competence protein ComEC/Rec2 [Holophagae bacterium]